MVEFNPVVAPPGGASYSAPLLNFGGPGGMANTLLGQADAVRKLQLQNAFSNGIPVLPGTTIPDSAAMAQTLAKLGGADQAISLANAAVGQQANLGATNFLANPGAPPASGQSQAPQASGSYPQRVAQAESSGNPNPPPNPASSASGLFQFTNGTWADVAKAHPELGLTPDGRSDPEQQQKAFAAFTADNQTALKSAGVPVNDRTTYLAHFLGAQGATNFLKSATQNWSAPATTLVSPEAVNANQNVFFNKDGSPKTAAQFYRDVTNKVAGATPTDAPTDVSAQSRIAPSPSVNPTGGQPASVGTRTSPAADPTLGGLIPQGWTPATYINALSSKAAQPGISAQAKDALLKRMELVGQAMQKAAEQTPEMKNYLFDRQPNETMADYEARVAQLKKQGEVSAENTAYTPEQKNFNADHQPGETMAQYQARVAGLKEGATAPYKIAQAAVREGGRPIAIKPNEVITTGAAANPALEGITNWAATKLGLPGEVAQPTGVPAAAPNGGAPIVPSGALAPIQSGQTAPVPSNPTGVTGQSAFTPRLVRNPDGSLASSVTPSTETLQKTAADDYNKAHESFNASQPVQMQLSTLENAFRNLNQSNWSKQGTGANARAEIGKAVNSVWQLMGVKDQDLPFDPSKIGSWETATKESTRLGFSLARTLGAREAMQIVQGAIKANPSVENTPLGAKMVLNTIRQNSQRDTDRYQFLTNYAQTHGGDLIGADVAFNKQNPPQIYAQRAMVQAQKDIPQEAIEALKSNPALASSFDQHYGQQGLSKLFIGAAQ